MTPKEIETYVDAAAALLALPIAPGHRPGVLHYFALAASYAALLDAHPLGVGDVPAGAFVPVSPGAAASDGR